MIILYIVSLLLIALNCWAHVTMDIIKDRRTHRDYGHPYKIFWHFVQLFRDSSAWCAGGTFILAMQRVDHMAGYIVVYLGWIVLCKLTMFEFLYHDDWYKDWCYFQDNFKFRMSLGFLNDFMGFKYNPDKLSKAELDAIWDEMRSK